MKEFEKWWKEIQECSALSGISYSVPKNEAQGIWKRALKWTMRRGMHHYGNDFLTDMNELSSDIRRELGELI